ncbi:TPA: DUF1868 domain-containing protein [Legionella pneumophila]|uniref:DUF1868 domain-containing protein n=1 Tax=Legionella pneumophila TaxID=446 RepID=UPI000786F33A|nr:DUF1868 domain-containing protein [Legionella pneumophila]HAU1191966.1 DUF1868 domain-containing protein [Legionella pneumophila]HBD7102424.1 DUF1868 domain-containing protein [Legionella pneumophila]HCO4738927.1 DUF1868 domain-containing protein [Legionella pneumophila]HDU7929374.1 DUF1868 domain-containing protein [Legionella pneumophila]HDU7935559.1 DUF1868 domain-containing protein [Legionella pneumophila]
MAKRYLDKINAQGQYTEFPGITVIANTSKNDSAFWEKIYDVLSKSSLVSNYFAPLPQKSYHMTAINIYTEMADGGDNWGKFVTERLHTLRELAALLEKNKIYPQVKLKSIRTSGVIQLQVEIPQEQREVIEWVAETFNIRHKVPKEMHITLAYQYKLVTGSDDEKLKKYLEEEIQRIFDEHPYITFEAPTLSYFKNMEKFTTWDARKNPFISKRFNFFPCLHPTNNEDQGESMRLGLD